jgi:1,3-beta-glucan synthase
MNLNSRQIRPPIYSMKQSKLRKRRVWRFAILYFVMLVVFLALLVGPIVAGKIILDGTDSLTKNPDDLFNLFQPTGQNNNDTRGYTKTGTGTGAAAATSAASDSTGKIKLF